MIRQQQDLTPIDGLVRCLKCDRALPRPRFIETLTTPEDFGKIELTEIKYTATCICGDSYPIGATVGRTGEARARLLGRWRPARTRRIKP